MSNNEGNFKLFAVTYNLQPKQSKLVHFENTMGAMDGTAYFAGTVSYTRKMFMNSTTGANL
jgi:hypothetical protein